MSLQGLESHDYDASETWSLTQIKRNVGPYQHRLMSIITRRVSIVDATFRLRNASWAFEDSIHISMWASLGASVKRHVTLDHTNQIGVHYNGPWYQRDLSNQNVSATIHGSISTVRVRAGAIEGDTHFTWVSQSIDTAHNPTHTHDKRTIRKR